MFMLIAERILIAVAPLGCTLVIGCLVEHVPGRREYRWGPSVFWQRVDDVLQKILPVTWAAVVQAALSGLFHAWVVYWMLEPAAQHFGFASLWAPSLVLAFWLGTGCQLAMQRDRSAKKKAQAVSE